MNLYLAAPLFTRAEIDFNARLALCLRDKGYEVFLPQENEVQEASADSIFEQDRAGIDWADVVVACMDGADPDSGTCWECGYAFGKDKNVVLFRTDIREEMPPLGPYNLMLHQSADAVLDCRGQSIPEISRKIDAALVWGGALGK
jgi:nucleoside 2-deoxyribosyltransferase